MGVYLLHAHVSKQAARFAPRNHANCDDLCTRRKRFSRSFINVRVIALPCSRSFANSRGRVDSWTNFAWNKGGVGWQRDASRDRYRIFSLLFRVWMEWKVDYRGINWGMDIFGKKREFDLSMSREKLNNFLTWMFIQVNIGKN